MFGRIEGELRASDLLIGDGAQIEGSVIAQNVTVCGRVKGTIHAVRVKLQNGGAVEGDIFHKSLSIDESSLFEGLSRRVRIERPQRRALVRRKKTSRAPTSSSSIDADLQRVKSARAEWSVNSRNEAIRVVHLRAAQRLYHGGRSAPVRPAFQASRMAHWASTAGTRGGSPVLTLTFGQLSVVFVRCTYNRIGTRADKYEANRSRRRHIRTCVTTKKQEPIPAVADREINQFAIIFCHGFHRDVEKFAEWLVEVIQAQQRANFSGTQLKS